MKKLSLAIYWHMHQPVYKIEGMQLMPWTRLHAVKDYLDMVLMLERYPNLKLNIDIVPAILDTILEYLEGSKDIHMELSVANVENMTSEEKSFVLNNFFSPKFETMIFRSENYRNMYQKRFTKDFFSIDDFDNRELSDLMALFNLVWIDPLHYKRYPELQELWDKQYNYTQEDRIKIIGIHSQIMREIIPAYKKYISEGRMELTVSPYYHAILPILVDEKSVLKSVSIKENLPQSLEMSDYARTQISMALNRIEEIFGFRPKGVWSPELCISAKSLDLMVKEGVEWTLSDEGNLAESLGINFVRDFKGNLNDPYHLLKIYEYKTKTSPINIIFRDRSIPGLINLEYPELDSKVAADDLYGKIKVIQDKLLASPDDEHLLTIATDGENCWENFQNDGMDFLDNIYTMIENDSSLETVLISDYMANCSSKKQLNKIASGSWIDQSFRCWIGDPTKNKAWAYLKGAIDEFELFCKNNKNHSGIQAIRQEILISQGSDWFWWYGEPNHSEQDFIFDYMFRERLKNIYVLMGKEPPEELNLSLITKIEVPLKHPSREITPRMDGLNESSPDWYYSGTMSLLDGPVFRENRSISKIDYGCDDNNLYMRLHINKNNSEHSFIDRINQFYLYMRNATNAGNRAFIRLISKTENEFSVLKEKFEYELTLTLVKDNLYPPRLVSCVHSDMWTLSNPEGINLVYKDVLDLTIPFDLININHGETVEFFIANTDSGVKNTNISQEILLSMTRK